MFIEFSTEVYRILKEQADGAWAICCDAPTAPIFVNSIELGKANRVPAPACYQPDKGNSLTVSQAARLAQIAPLLADEMCISDPAHRHRVAVIAAHQANVSPRTIKRTYYRYLAHGTLRPRSPTVRQPPAQDSTYATMHRAITEDHFSARHPSLQDTYDLMLLKYFTATDGTIQPNAPSLSAFRHFYYRNGYHRRRQKSIARDGLEHYQRNLRPLSGTSAKWKDWLGAYQVDATIADIHLVSERDRAHVVGRPNIFLCVDTATQLIAGVYVGYQGGEEAMMASIVNAASDKVAYCKQYDIDITPEQWPSWGLPAEIISDQGSEYINGRRDELCVRYGIVWEALPPFRPDEKGTVEKVFDLLQSKYKPTLRGYGVIDTQTTERWSTDYRQQATLTLSEFTRVIIYCILHLNNDRVLRSACLTPEMIQAGIGPTPMGLWRYYQAIGQSRLLDIDENEVYRMSLPRDTARLTRSGIRYRRLGYVNPAFLREPDGELLVGRDVTIAYDPQNSSSLFIVLPTCYIPFELEGRLSMHAGLPQEESSLLNQMSRSAMKHQNKKEQEGRVRLLREMQNIRDCAKQGGAI